VACHAQAEAKAAAPAAASKTGSYFVVNNVFKVKPEYSNDFEETWKSRESHLKEMPGFMRFAMLKCTNVPGKYVSQTTWSSKEHFEAWTKSSQFQSSHSKPSESKNNRPSVMTMLEGPPAPELFETVTITE